MKYLLIGSIIFIISILLLIIKIKLKKTKIIRKLRTIKNAKVLRNYVINEIKMDYILLCEKGIFVINEIKYKGDAFGDDYSQEFTISHNDKIRKIKSPQIECRKYIKMLKRVLHTMGYDSKIKIYQATIFTRANISFVNSSFIFDNVKDIIKIIKNLNYSMNKQTLLVLAKDLDNSRKENNYIEEFNHDSLINLVTQ